MCADVAEGLAYLHATPLAWQLPGPVDSKAACGGGAASECLSREFSATTVGTRAGSVSVSASGWNAASATHAASVSASGGGGWVGAAGTHAASVSGSGAGWLHALPSAPSAKLHRIVHRGECSPNHVKAYTVCIQCF